MELNQLYPALLDAIDDPLVAVTRDGAVTFTNAAATAFFDFGPEATLAGAACADEHFVFDGAELMQLAQAGAPVLGHAVLDRSGEETGVTLDVLPVRTAGESLALLRVRRGESCEYSDFWKDDMISMVSHEIKNPLAAMKNSVDILLSQMPGDLTDGQRRFLDTSGRSIDRLTRMLDGFLDVSRIRSGAFELHAQRHDVREFLDRVVGSFATLFNVTRVRLDWDVDADVVEGWFDAAKLEQVIVNLLSNALKFTPAGGAIAVHARAGGIECINEHLRLMPWTEVGTPRVIEFEVRDTGIGMTGETLGTAFDRFGAADGDGPQARGAHLGLNISRMLTEAQGGWLEVSSTLGIGTNVRVRLPGDRRTAAVLARLGQATALLRRLHASHREATVYVLGKESDDNWMDVAATWTGRPEINPGPRARLGGGFYLWTLSRTMALAVATDTGADAAVADLFSSRFVACEERALVFPSWAAGRAQLPADASASPQLIGIATSRMTRARKVLARTTLESLDTGLECIRTEWQAEP